MSKERVENVGGITGRLLPLAVCIAVYALYGTGFQLARRDLGLGGDVLYLARFCQLATSLAVALAFRDHVPSVSRLMAAASAALGVHTALLAAGYALGGLSEPITALSHAVGGVANGLFILLTAHFFSSYGPAVSSVAIACAFLSKEVLFAWSSVWPQGAIHVMRVVLCPAGAALFALALRLKPRNPADTTEHPLQYGFSDARPKSDGGRPFQYLVNGADWAYQVAVAAVTPFIYGFVSQLLSVGALSDGPHDPVSEVASLAVLAVLVLAMTRHGATVAFLDKLIPVVMLYAVGLALMPTLWTAGSPATGVAFKCAGVLDEALLWVLLARKAHEDPRRTYLYFGAKLLCMSTRFIHLRLQPGIVLLQEPNVH